MKEVIVIGGGAAGLTAAINAKTPNNKVTILERNNSCGKKVLVTGNGRCNYFNDDFNAKKYHSSTLDSFEKIINENNKKIILNFFDSLGVVPRIKNGYYYPSSNQAVSILNALTLEATNKGIGIINNTMVTDIKKEDKFIISTENNIYKADIVIVACGGMALPKSGSDGKLYDVLKSLNHDIVNPLPALVQLKSNYKYLKDLSGVRCDVLVSNNNHEELGELQFTNYGLSGICIMQLSNYIVDNVYNGKKEEISINYLPTVENVKEFLIKLDKVTNNRSVGNLLDQLLNYKIVNVLLKEVGINYDEKLSDMKDDKLNKLVDILTNHKIEIIGTNTFMEAQVTKGGVSVNDIDVNSFESKVISDLYLVGEVLDVNGDCGGYNLGFAWLSGIIAGKSVAKK